MPALVPEAEGTGGEAMLFASLFGAVIPEHSETVKPMGDTAELTSDEAELTDAAGMLALAGFAAPIEGDAHDGAEDGGQMADGQPSQSAATQQAFAQMKQKQEGRNLPSSSSRTAITPSQAELINGSEELEDVSMETPPQTEKPQNQNTKLSNAFISQLPLGKKSPVKANEITIQKQTYRPSPKQVLSQAENAGGKASDGMPTLDEADSMDGAELKTRMNIAAEALQKTAASSASARVSETQLQKTTLEQQESHTQAQNQSSAGAGQNNSQFQQQGGQPHSSGLAPSSSLSENMAEMLDMMEDNWSEMLVKRIERAFGKNAEGIDFELNPRNLGKLRVNINVVNDQTNVQLKTDTQMAAQMIGDAESKLAQMLEQAGLKLAQFNAQTGHSEQQSNGQAGQHNQKDEQGTGQSEEHDPENDNEKSHHSVEHVVNLQA